MGGSEELMAMAPNGDPNDQHTWKGNADGATVRGGEAIARWTAHLAAQRPLEIGRMLPPHSPQCAGCGPENPAGLGLHVVRTAAGVEAIHHFSEAQVGAPGIAHGGAVAMAFDDLFGFALYTVGSLAVTRSLTIEYQAPFILHHPYTFRAEVADRAGRRLLLRADAWDEAGGKAGSASATFVVVEPQHFTAASGAGG